MSSRLLSFVIRDDIEPPDDIERGSIWGDLFKAIAEVVTGDGIRETDILDGQSAAGVTINAVENIYYDVAELFYWYFDEGDWAGRNKFMKTQKAATILSPLRGIVKPVAEWNLANMREERLIPEGGASDVDGVTDNLTRYILNWQDWYYDRKEAEEYEDYLYSKSMYEDIYESDYGDMTNSTNYLDDEVDNPEYY